MSRLRAEGINNYELLQYPGTGHLLDMSFMPVITITRWGYRGMLKNLDLSGELIIVIDHSYNWRIHVEDDATFN